MSMVKIRKAAVAAADRPHGYADAVFAAAAADDETFVYLRRAAYDELRRRYSRRGLGDMVAAGLATVGITKERVSKALGRDCGCAKRQAALNEFGKRLGIGNADAGPPLPPQR